jgi:class 3 adenylate cyclase/tetratricopeptide (TPR) repeat protein
MTVQLDPEDMMHVIDVYLATCDRVIDEHGGYIMQYMGDGVLAYFGYPRADEDDTGNAVRAGLALRDAVGGLGSPLGIPLRVRIGIATGQVVVSDLVGQGKGREAGLVGETPNLAARLQSSAAPGAVVVAKATQAITRGQFTYRDLGAMSLKGFDDPVEVFEAIGATAAAGRFQARAIGKATPLVGRTRELRLLLGAWSDARAGRGRVVFVHGEPGIGKSRLVEELRTHAADTTHVSTVWHCGPNSVDSALYPIANQLARTGGIRAGDGDEAREERLAGLLAGLGENDPLIRAVLADLLGLPDQGDSPFSVLPPERRRDVALGTLLDVMDRLARARPALFVLEDAHWADATTLELLDRAIGRAADRAWLLIVTARPEFQPAWSARADILELRLGRLDHGDAERICRHVGGDGLVPADAVRQILARSDGVPLFVEEMTRSVLEASAADPESVAAIAIPMSVKDSLAARLDRLGDARRVASLGAAIGRRFSYDLLAAVADHEAADLRRALRTLTLSGLVERSGLPPSSAYVFKHALIRDAAYDSLLKRERQALHGRIASVLRDRFPQARHTEPELLAYHFTESGATTDAIPLWSDAGRRAAHRGAHVEAIGHLQAALRLLRRQAPDEARTRAELDLLIGIAGSLAMSRGYSEPEVGGLLAEARGLCETLSDSAEMLPVYRGMYNFWIVAGDVAAAEDMARRIVDIAGRTGSPGHIIEGEAILGYVLFARGALSDASVHLARVAPLYARHDGARLPPMGPNDPLIAALSAQVFVLHAMGDDAGAADAMARLDDHARTLGRPSDLAWAIHWMALHHLLTLNHAQARALAEEGLIICKTHGYTLYELIMSNYIAYAIGYLGQPAEALGMLQTLLPMFKAFGMSHFISCLVAELAGLYLAVGETEAARRTIDEAIDGAHRHGDGYFLSPLYCRRAEILSRIPGVGPEAVAADFTAALSIANAQGATGFARRAQAGAARHRPGLATAANIAG